MLLFSVILNGTAWSSSSHIHTHQAVYGSSHTQPMQAWVPNLNSENLNLTKKSYLNTSNFFMPWWLHRKLQGRGLHSVPKSSKYLLSLEVLFKLLKCSEDIRDCCCLRKMFPSIFKEDLKGLESTEWWERQSYLIHMAQKYLVDVTDWRSISIA